MPKGETKCCLRRQILCVFYSFFPEKDVKTRKAKFFNGARMLARKKGLKFESQIVLNPKWDERTISTQDGTLLSYQDTETWELCAPQA